jgi:hypothetical protein
VPHHSNHVTRVCEYCRNEFLFNAMPSSLQRGLGRFCSRLCHARSKMKSQVNRVCEVCGNEFLFHASPSRVRQGLGRFCSRDCWRRYLDIPLVDRFRAYVGPQNDNGCILWTGPTRKGYGVIALGSRQNGRNPHVLLAHRVAYEFAHGPIPDGLGVLHSCDTPPCVNIQHLFLGTQTDNNADAVSKGRNTKGTKSPIAKLDDDSVKMIRERYKLGGITQAQLAREHGVSSGIICEVISLKRWKHV